MGERYEWHGPQLIRAYGIGCERGRASDCSPVRSRVGFGIVELFLVEWNNRGGAGVGECIAPLNGACHLRQPSER